jgi:DNA-directed RNA polymerase subunit RPC12/RpoP
VRLIEPYSMRRTQAGDIVLHALRADGLGHRSYRVDRIVGARASSRSFTPRYAIELTPTGPISAPPSSFARPAPWPSPSRRTGPMYVYECSRCNKRFEHSKRDATLRAHKDKNGWACSGRHGVWVETK